MTPEPSASDPEAVELGYYEALKDSGWLFQGGPDLEGVVSGSPVSNEGVNYDLLLRSTGRWDEVAAAWARGLRMDLRASLQHALTGERLPTNPPLSPRKREIVRLVAAGLSDKEIAWRMSISVRTVQSHLEQVRGRLGFHNRRSSRSGPHPKGS